MYIQPIPLLKSESLLTPYSKKGSLQLVIHTIRLDWTSWATLVVTPLTFTRHIILLDNK